MSRDLEISPTKSDNFVFVSYNSGDDNRVKEYVRDLNNLPFGLWYDAGIKAEEWEKKLSLKISLCDAFLVFVTRNLFEKNNSVVFDEFQLAQSLDKTIIPIFLDTIDIKSINEELRLYFIKLSKYQGVEAWRYNNIVYKKVSSEVARLLNIADSANWDKNNISLWGPDRPIYKSENPPSLRCFNSFLNNPEIGDERNFVRVREKGSSLPYLNSIPVEKEKVYEVWVYYHNNCDEILNNSGEGIADNVCLKIESPAKVKSGESAVIKVYISSKNCTPCSVYDSCCLEAYSDIHLSYVADSLKIFNEGVGIDDGMYLSSRQAFSYDGVLLVYWHDNQGIIPAGYKYSGFITFCLKAD